ncbi:MAG: dephospho-CoA kinase [Shimia sp.]
MTLRLGLTGSIGMGKSATARLFAAHGAAIWDADATVHRLYSSGGAAVAPVAALVPAVHRDGSIDRAALAMALRDDPSLFPRLEAIVHPLVAADRAAFATAAWLAVFDIPLLFETGMQDGFDATACVATDAATQRARVLARPGMTSERLDQILAKQWPSADKEAAADFVIDTTTPETAQADVARIVANLRERRDARDRPGHRDHRLRARRG